MRERDRQTPRPCYLAGPWRYAWAIPWLILSTSCGSDPVSIDGEEDYTIPEQTGDGWQTASLQDVGLEARPMVELKNYLDENSDHLVHGVVVIKDGRLVFEEYYSGDDLDFSDLGNGPRITNQDFDRNTLHAIASDTKSVTSILLGIAIDEGLVSGTDQTLFSFFPECADLSDATKSQITLEHALAMASGLEWDGGYPLDPNGGEYSLLMSTDPVRYALDRPVVAPPGTAFNYNSGMTNLLGEVIRRTSGQTLVEFADEHLFGLLGIDVSWWYEFPNAPGVTHASGGLFLRPRDMAKIGQLYLDSGVWEGNRVVSESWVAQSTQPAVDMDPSDNPIPSLNAGYGFHWWLGTFSRGNTETFFAAGFGGQFIFVFPALEMVAVVTAGDFVDEDYDALVGLVNHYVLRAAGR